MTNDQGYQQLDPYEDGNGDDDEFFGYAAAGGKNALAPGEKFNHKVPPALSPDTAWFTYEEMVLDWLDMTSIAEEKRGPLLKSRVTGTIVTYTRQLDREKLRTESGVEYFLSQMRPRFVKSADSVFLWRFFRLLKFNRGHQDMQLWITKFSMVHQQAVDSWMDLSKLPLRTSQAYIDWLAEKNLKIMNEKIIEHHQAQVEEDAKAGSSRTPPRLPFEEPEKIEDSDAVYNEFKKAWQDTQIEAFPLSDHLMSLIFMVFSDLSLQDREKAYDQVGY